MKSFKRILLAIIYLAFSVLYAFSPKFGLGEGSFVMLESFNPETFIMMIFIGAYITGFWIFINRLFRN